MVAAVPMKNPDQFWNARLTVPAVISRFPVFFHEPRVSLNDSPRTPLGENWIEKMKLKLPSRLICSICAPSTRTAKYVPAILSPRPPSSSAKAQPACSETTNVAMPISATAATNIDHLWVRFILSSACINNEPSPLFSPPDRHCPASPRLDPGSTSGPRSKLSEVTEIGRGPKKSPSFYRVIRKREGAGYFSI